jgi:Fe-S cluster assembly protein SufD
MICSHSCDVMNAVRDEAFKRFASVGFPTRKVERYKYTDLQKLFEPDYGLNLNRLTIPVDPYKTSSCDVPNLSTSLYFVVNDHFYSQAQPNAHLPEGVVIGSLREFATTPYYNRLAGKDGDAVTDLNTMLAQDGLYVYVPKNVKVDRAIQVINILKTPFKSPCLGGQQEPSPKQERQEGSLMVNRRVLIVLEEGAEIKLLFCDHAADDRNFLTTQVVEVFAGENSSLDIYELEETHEKNKRFSNLYVDQKSYSNVLHDSITLYNGSTRNMADFNLNGQGAEVHSYGCAIADSSQHIDNNTLISHNVPNCQSDQLYKYVLDDKAVGAFAGRILVKKDAQKTVSQETNSNLCVSKEARMFTQQMLEIYADDVKCSHGSTVGQLDEMALFYMRQRGISEAEARRLLQNAFCSQAIEQIRLEPLRDRLHMLVDKRFRGELNKCGGCKGCK